MSGRVALVLAAIAIAGGATLHAQDLAPRAYTITPVGSNAITLANADCIRRWGTSAGIGELALKGPLLETKLDPAGTVTVPRTSIIALIDASESSWPGR